ncbi:MAG TPA: hypothetical protein PL003_08425 [Bacteroidales bacterium]|nr:hypothetical protein [Bacteroidales bacterium]
MREDKLKILLEKFYNGVTGPEEETELKNYFSGKSVLPGYETDQEVFSGLSGLDYVPEPSEDFNERINKYIDDSIAERRRFINFRKAFVSVSGIAAAVLLFIGLYFVFVHEKMPKDTFSDPEIAYTETMKLLNDISLKLNKGTESLKAIRKFEDATQVSKQSLEKSTEIISETIKKIEPVIQLSDLQYDDKSDDI